ncbi:response regulator transcription factor [Siphonobacter aquaeclarae]|uniref:DNA-binding response regulator, OmpR family, contains REC and winged-helix (WHTH) domain n=1 Tax=Siphonobacter aquaeclarae TaxID=563176 RepID=A0A1G9VHM0_9BACT|nr:response regulator transcription factor [Siphonobacter aquaeclarae]SDM71722.1 DNA-binding response regulator, OmpR family, contains REC and winged-helix (wHTH) domain [Siphonobacter aquaeclarae]
MSQPRILLVEDDETLGFVVKDNLEQEGYEVDWKQDGRTALEALQTEIYELCLFDVMLPEMDGFSLAEEVRREGNPVPIIFLTARSLKEDRIRGFRAGGDDYLVKPFSMEELVLRMEAILRRTSGKEKRNFSIGRYRFDSANQRLSSGDFSIDLTAREAALLKLLAERVNEVVSRDEILVRLWGKKDYFLGRSLDVFVSRLRKYLREDENLRLVSVHGVGFRLENSPQNL